MKKFFYFMAVTAITLIMTACAGVKDITPISTYKVSYVLDEEGDPVLHRLPCLDTGKTVKPDKLIKHAWLIAPKRLVYSSWDKADTVYDVRFVARHYAANLRVDSIKEGIVYATDNYRAGGNKYIITTTNRIRVFENRPKFDFSRYYPAPKGYKTKRLEEIKKINILKNYNNNTNNDYDGRI